MSIKTIPFDLAQCLDNEEVIQEYLSQVLEDGDSAEIIRAIGAIARARGMADIAKQSGLGRESLYKTLSEGGKPRFETILKIVRALGLKLTAHAA
ncbi:MAG: putative addiction module antidote protein [Betaproteobacteria bacterium]|nr:putative addiction module antidote protein [Betaproteobacteria bacterium]